jgi:hypothetical protein
MYLTMLLSVLSMSLSMTLAFKPIKIINHNRYSAMRMSASPASTHASIVRVSTHSTINRSPALYLPGVDGLGSYSTNALYNMSLEYDLYRLEIQPVSHT